MSNTAAFWDNPDANDDTPVIRHAPDTNNYHVPDDAMLGKMRGSRVGRFAIVPAANRDGTSKGFNASIAGPVHVDPGAPDGGVVFDPSQVNSNEIVHALNNSVYPHQVYYHLGAKPQLNQGRAQAQEAPRANSIVPNSYIVPKSSENGTQLPSYVSDGGMSTSLASPLYQAQEEQRMHPVPPLNVRNNQGPVMTQNHPQSQAPQFVQQPQQQFVQQSQQMPQQYQYPQYQVPLAPPAPPALDPNVLALMQQVTSMQQQLASVTQQQLRPQTTGLSHNPMPVGRPPLRTLPKPRGGENEEGENFDEDTARPIRQRVRRDKESQEIVEVRGEEPQQPRRRSTPSVMDREEHQTVREYEASQHDDPRDGVIVGFEALEIPFIRGPVGVKASVQVFFDIPNAGRYSAWYHQVIDAKNCIALVYDTRYTEGMQYLPPELDANVHIKMYVGKNKKEFVVASLGITYSCGVLDHIVLIKIPEEHVALEE